MKNRTLFFTAPHRVDIVEQELPPTGSNKVLIKTLYSTISSGTEMLAYRGQFSRKIPVDACIPGLEREFSYPLAYGYATVGRVIEAGNSVSQDWLGRLVFAFQPHTTHFLAEPQTLQGVPDHIAPETASFLPNMETAVNLVQDAAPIIGEKALVFGQGILGLLTTALLREFPLPAILTIDRHPLRRKASLELGVSASLDPLANDFLERARYLLPAGADFSIELSGVPSALNEAIQLTGYGGRVLIGSWYGDKPAILDLGGAFHRSRIKLIASQVSSIAPELSARWDKARRFKVAWDALGRIQPDRWITHRFPLERGGEAYHLLDEHSENAIQVIFVYE